MEIIKKILSVIGIIALAFIVLIMIADDDTTPTQQPGSVIDEQGDSAVDEGKSGDSEENEGYYTLVFKDGSSVDILKPHTISDDIYSNMNEQRLNSIFTSIYNYNYKRDDVYIAYIPDSEQVLRDMIKEPYTIGSIFHFDMQVTGNPGVIGTVSGYVQGDDSLGMMDMDTSYIEDEKYDLMDGDIVAFDAVYAGLDIASTPVFIALSMNVQ